MIMLNHASFSKTLQAGQLVPKHTLNAVTEHKINAPLTLL